MFIALVIGAVTGHPRVGDTKNLTMPLPLPPLVLSIAVLVLRLVTA